jgi:hypothetical protein
LVIIIYISRRISSWLAARPRLASGGTIFNLDPVPYKTASSLLVFDEVGVSKSNSSPGP